MMTSTSAFNQQNCKKNRAETPSASSMYLAAGMFCYGLASVLFLFESRIRSSACTKSISTAARAWLHSEPVSVVFCLAGLIILLAGSIYWFKKDFISAGKPKKNSPDSMSAFRTTVFILFFMYALFPLKWMNLAPGRSLESYPDMSVLEFGLLLLILSGTVCCCLYCFCNLPRKIAISVDKAIAGFGKLNQFFSVIAIILASLLITGILAYFVLNHIPHVQDSIAQLFHAKIFLSGYHEAEAPPHKEFFDYINMLNYKTWYSQYPPGHIVMLTLGLIAGVPWLVGPVLGALSLPLFFVLTKKTYGDSRTALLCCFLMLFSPFFLFMSSSHMNHTTTLFFTLLFLYCYTQIYLSGRTVFALGAGLALGYVLNVRPLTAGALGVIFIFYLLYSWFLKKEIKLKNILVFSAALAVMVGLLLLFNQLTNGDPLVFGYQKKYQTLGFLGKAQEGAEHTLKGGLINTSNNLIGMNQSLFEWPIPSLVFAFIFFAVPIKKNRWDRLFLCAALMVIVSYFFYYYQDLCFGPRFYYSIMPFAIIFSVRGFLGLPGWLAEKGFDRKNTRATLTLLLVVCFAFNFLFSFPKLISKYSDDYWYVTDKIHTEVKNRGIKNALVFIDVWIPRGVSTPNLISYGSGFQFISPDLSNDVIYAIDLREKNSELMNYYSGRDFYLCKIFTPMHDFELIKIKPPEK